MTTSAQKRARRDGTIEDHHRVTDPDQRYMLVMLNALLLREGGQAVVADSFIIGQPLREVLIDRRQAGYVVMALGATEDEVAAGRSSPHAVLWHPGMKPS